MGPARSSVPRLLTDPPAEQLRRLRRELSRYRREVQLVVGDELETDPLAALRARIRAD